MPSPNLLKEAVITLTLKVGEVMVGDITYLPLANGRFLLSGDVSGPCVTKRIAGWSVGIKDDGRRLLSRLFGNGPQERLRKTDRDHPYRPREPVRIDGIPAV